MAAVTGKAVTAEYLAVDLGVDPDDIRYIVSEYLGLDLHDEVIPRVICGEVRSVLNPQCERTVPQLYGAGGDDI